MSKIFNGRQYRRKSMWKKKVDAEKQVKLHRRMGDYARIVKEEVEIKKIMTKVHSVYSRRGGDLSIYDFIDKKIDGKLYLGTGKKFSSKTDAERVAKNMRKMDFSVRIIKDGKKYQIFFRRGRK